MVQVCNKALAALFVVLVLVVAARAASSIEVCQFTSNDCSGSATCATFENGACLSYEEGDYVSIRVSFTCSDNKLQTFNISKYVLNDCFGDAVTLIDAKNNGVPDKACYQLESPAFPTTYNSLYLTNFPDNCTSSGDCFAETARVELDDGSFVPMTQLELGDRVRISASEFSPVVFWGHRDADTVSANFVLAELASGRQIMLTANHLAYVNGKLVPAGTIRVGDLMNDVELDEESAVEAVQHGLRAKGLYNPHTAHGDIVVDGVVVSTYGVVDARIAHSLLMIERMLRSVGLSLLGDMLEKQTPLVLRRIMSIAS